jgi:4-aminobutyrate aminotransferase
VMDEAKVGLARSGAMHAFTHDGVVPDIVVFGKGLGGGLPLGAAVGPARIMDHASGFALQTLHGNPYAAAAALAVLDAIEHDHLAAHAARTGQHFIEGLAALAQKHPCIGNIRGRGLALGVEIIADRHTKVPAKLKTIKIALRAFELGALFYYVSPQGNVLEFTPPLVISAEEIDAALGIIDQAIIDVEAGAIDDATAERFAAW